MAGTSADGEEGLQQVLLHRTAEAIAAAKRLRDASRGGRRARPLEAEEMVTRCAWCSRFRVDGEWVLAVRRRGGVVVDLQERTSHGICPDCAELLGRTGQSV
jgi:hypothetical protein